MARPHFHEELDKLELQLLTLGELAGMAVRNAVDAVARHDEALAQQVMEGDDEIDQLYLSLDQGVLSLLALQAPVAADLGDRFGEAGELLVVGGYDVTGHVLLPQPDRPVM